MARKDIKSYFSHDANARNDEKIIRLRMKHGAAGYGVYFMILERLRGETNYMSVKDYNIIAFDFRIDAALVKSVVEDFGLFAFTEDGKCFYSESFLRRMEMKDSVSDKRKDAAAARWGKKTEYNHSEKCNPVNVPVVKTQPSAVPTQTVQPQSQITSQSYSRTVDSEVAEMKRNAQWKESVYARYQLDNKQLDSLLADFALNCDKQHTSMQDAQSHFCRWLAKKTMVPRISKAAEIAAEREKERAQLRKEEEEHASQVMHPDEYLKTCGLSPGTSMAEVARGVAKQKAASGSDALPDDVRAALHKIRNQ